METPDYYRERSFLQPVSGYVRRVYHVVGWMFGADNDVSLYWEAKERQDVLQEQIVYVLNRHLFADRALLDRQVEILLQSIKEKEETAACAMDIHVRRINRQTTDVDVHRTKLPTMEP